MECTRANVIYVYELIFYSILQGQQSVKVIKKTQTINNKYQNYTLLTLKYGVNLLNLSAPCSV